MVSLVLAFAVVFFDGAGRFCLDRAGLLVIFFFKAGLLCLHFECVDLVEASTRLRS
jgi:hypothetical protein